MFHPYTQSQTAIIAVKDMSRIFAVVFLVSIGSLLIIPNATGLCRLKSLPMSPPANYQKPVDQMEFPTRLLSPAAFPQLPQNIVRNLQARRCKVPQFTPTSPPFTPTYPKPAPHNVIHGRFAKPDQYDWAIFCLRDGISSIVIYWGGSTTSVSEIEKGPDVKWSYFTGGFGDYGRAIFRANKKTILHYHKEYYQPGIDPPLPPIDHDGIEDAYLEKASTIHYYYRKKWLGLHGSD
jgi:hypothetical protein